MQKQTRPFPQLLLALLLGALLVSGAAHAEERFMLHLNSKHSNSSNAEEFNLGVGVRFDDAKGRTWATGLYRNSHGDPALYGARSFNIGKIDRVSLSVETGLVIGYQSVSDAGVLPLATATVVYDLPGTSLDPALTISPTGDGVVGLLSITKKMDLLN